MELRNIHFMADENTEESATVSSAPEPATDYRLKLRKTAVSPLEEYALREGEVAPISDSLAALICSRAGRAEINAKGIIVDRKDIGGRRTYHHVDSILCNDLSSRERKIFYVINSMKPDIVHLLDETGRYIESLPEKRQPGVLNNEEQAKELADQKRQLSRVARQMQELHGEETAQAIEDLRTNNSIAQRIVQVMPSNSPSPANAPAPSALGDRIEQGSRKINQIRSQHQSAIAFGRAAAASGSRYTAPADESPAEDWSANPRHESSIPVLAAAEDWSSSPITTHQTPTEEPEQW